MRRWLSEASLRRMLIAVVCFAALAALPHHTGITFAQGPGSNRIISQRARW